MTKKDGLPVSDAGMKAAMRAAWPGMPSCMTLPEAERRTAAAIQGFLTTEGFGIEEQHIARLSPDDPERLVYVRSHRLVSNWRPA